MLYEVTITQRYDRIAFQFAEKDDAVQFAEKAFIHGMPEPESGSMVDVRINIVRTEDDD